MINVVHASEGRENDRLRQPGMDIAGQEQQGDDPPPVPSLARRCRAFRSPDAGFWRYAAASVYLGLHGAAKQIIRRPFSAIGLTVVRSLDIRHLETRFSVAETARQALVADLERRTQAETQLQRRCLPQSRRPRTKRWPPFTPSRQRRDAYRAR